MNGLVPWYMPRRQSLMAAGRERVKQEFGVELEPEVQTFGPVEFPADWARA